MKTAQSSKVPPMAICLTWFLERGCRLKWQQTAQVSQSPAIEGGLLSPLGHERGRADAAYTYTHTCFMIAATWPGCCSGSSSWLAISRCSWSSWWSAAGSTPSRTSAGVGLVVEPATAMMAYTHPGCRGGKRNVVLVNEHMSQC